MERGFSLGDKLGYAVSGGVHSPQAVIKSILAGATAVEMCSAIYENTAAYIGELNKFIGEWMDKNGYDSIDQFKGKLNAKDIEGITMWERTQFLKYFSSKQ